MPTIETRVTAMLRQIFINHASQSRLPLESLAMLLVLLVGNCGTQLRAAGGDVATYPKACAAEILHRLRAMGSRPWDAFPDDQCWDAPGPDAQDAAELVLYNAAGDVLNDASLELGLDLAGGIHVLLDLLAQIFAALGLGADEAVVKDLVAGCVARYLRRHG